MKVSALLFASVAFVSLAGFADCASAAMTAPAAQKQAMPTFYRLTPNDPAADKGCTDKHGTVSTDEDGNKICTLQRSCSTGAPQTVKLDASDPNAAQKCKDACGTVSTDIAGAKVCTRPS